MGLFGNIAGVAGAGVGLALNLFGGARAARQRRRELAEQQSQNNAMHEQKAYANPLDNAFAQAAITAMHEGRARRMSAARGASAVMGASAGSQLAEKASSNEAEAGLMNKMALQGEQLRQAEDNRYMARNAEISNQRLNAINQQQQSFADAASNASKLAAGMSST